MSGKLQPCKAAAAHEARLCLIFSASGEERAAFAFLSFREQPQSAGSMAAAGISSGGGGGDSNNKLKWCACHQNLMPFGVCILVIKYFTPEKKKENKIVCDQVHCRLCVRTLLACEHFTHKRTVANTLGLESTE